LLVAAVEPRGQPGCAVHGCFRSDLARPLADVAPLEARLHS